MRRRVRLLGFSLAIGLALLTGSQAGAQDAASARIASPKSGDTVSGNNVTITGTAANANLKSYVLEFASEDTNPDQWFPIAPPVTQPVTNGPLGRWDTTTIPDGKYQIRLRVVKRDGTQVIDVVKDVLVTNRQPTPLPTIPPTATLPGLVTPSPGPSPTPAIQQPPSSTPRFTAVALPTDKPVLAPTSASVSPVGLIDFSSLGNAFCGGAWIAIGGFVILGVFSLVRTRFRSRG